MKNCIFFPFAFISGFKTGENIRSRHKKNSLEIYLKNLCVSAVSAKTNGVKDNETDVAIVTNVDLPAEYKEILDYYKIDIHICLFDTFNFGNQYRWSLAFYKLCALKYMVDNFSYDNYSYMDCDVYVQGNFSYIWEECKNKILLYDINHGLQIPNYTLFLDEIRAFGVNELVVHYGGEFFAACRSNSKMFIKKCEVIFNKMKENGFQTSFGDEFIISVASNQLNGYIKNAGAYIYRFWTGVFYRISTSYLYDPVLILHVPVEKMHGMVSLFRKYISLHKSLPGNKKVWRLLHLTHQSLLTRLKRTAKRIKR